MAAVITGLSAQMTAWELKKALEGKLAEYHLVAATGSESEINDLVGELHELAPHALITDLLFWGDKERSDPEIVEEALARDEIWRDRGEAALLVHREQQLQATLADPTSLPPYRNYATQELPRIAEALRTLGGKQVH